MPDQVSPAKLLIMDLMRADAWLNSICGGRFYDVLPETVDAPEPLKTPNTAFGPVVDQTDAVECGYLSEFSLQLDVRTDRDGGDAGTTKLAAEIAGKIKDVVIGEFTLPDGDDFEITHRITRVIEDGAYRRAIMTFTLVF